MPQGRELGYMETHFKIGNDLASGTGAIVAMIQVTGPLTADMVRGALQSLQVRHPVLRSYFGPCTDECDCLEVDEETVMLPLDVVKRKDYTRWMDVFQKYLCLQFTEGERYLWRATLLLGENEEKAEHELVVAFSHSVMDGISIGSFFGEFMEHCYREYSGEQQEIEPLPLSPAVEDLIIRRLEWPAFLEKTVGIWWTPIIELEKYLGRYEQFVPFEQRRNKTIYQEFHGQQLEKLVYLCRENDTTLTSLLYAALMDAVYKVNIGKDHKGKSRQIAVTGVNLRGLCEPEIEKERLGCYVGFFPTTEIFESNISLWEIARSYKRELDQFMEQDMCLPTQFSKSTVIQMFNSAHTMPLTNAFHWGIGITNIGRFDYPAHGGPLTINKLHFCVSDINGAFLIKLHALSLNDRLFCCFGYVEPLLSEKTARTITDNFISTLMSLTS